MKNLRYIYCLIFCFLVMGCLVGYSSPVFASTKLPNQVTTTLETPIYKDASLNSEMYTKDDTVIYLSVGTKLDVDTTFENDIFYKVNIFGVIDSAVDGDFGYVLKSQTLNSSIKSPAKKLDANAKVKNDNSQIFSYDYATKEYTPVANLVLNKDTQVRILDGYDKNKSYTYISFLNADNELVSYYIETSNLEVSGVNYSVIVAIIILISCAGILGAVFGVKAKKAKKKATK